MYTVHFDTPNQGIANPQNPPRQGTKSALNAAPKTGHGTCPESKVCASRAFVTAGEPAVYSGRIDIDALRTCLLGVAVGRTADGGAGGSVSWALGKKQDVVCLLCGPGTMTTGCMDVLEEELEYENVHHF